MLALAAAVAAVAACGGGEGRPLTIFAAASLTEVFEELAPEARFNFAGSDELAAQIREGAPADVYASASASHADRLFADGLVEPPRTFARNRLVLVVTEHRPDIRGLDDLLRDDVKLVVGAEGVPAGDYARELLERAGRDRVLDRVVSEEEDVKGVLGKVAAGEADAGFVYATDWRAAAGDVEAIELPEGVQPDVRYVVAVVRDAERRAEARAFVRLLLGPEGRRALGAAGFSVR